MEEVAGSTPVSSTLRVSNFTLGGIVAGEGCFTVLRKPPFADGRDRLRFVFTMTMARHDRHLLQALRDALGFGSIHEVPPRLQHHHPLSTLTVTSRRAHRGATIPFMDRYLLPPTAKRRQYERWRGRFLEYDELTPTRRKRSICSVEDCDGLVRGRGLCRRHYYRATGY